MKIDSVKGNKQYIEEVDYRRYLATLTAEEYSKLPEDKKRDSGISGGPLCSGCNPWLMKCTKEERKIYEQMMRDSIDITEYKKVMREKYEKRPS